MNKPVLAFQIVWQEYVKGDEDILSFFLLKKSVHTYGVWAVLNS